MLSVWFTEADMEEVGDALHSILSGKWELPRWVLGYLMRSELAGV